MMKLMSEVASTWAHPTASEEMSCGAWGRVAVLYMQETPILNSGENWKLGMVMVMLL